MRWRLGGVLACLLAGCGGSGDGGETVSVVVTPAQGGILVSADEQLRLHVPPGAVTDDTELTVRVLTTAEIDELPAAPIAANAAYELGPDGMQFALPVDVEIVLPLSAVERDGRVPLAVLASASANQTEVLRPALPGTPTARADFAGQVYAVFGQTTHFSRIWGTTAGFEPGGERAVEDRVRMAMTPGNVDAWVGESWPVAVSVFNRDDALPFSVPEATFYAGRGFPANNTTYYMESENDSQRPVASQPDGDAPGITLLMREQDLAPLNPLPANEGVTLRPPVRYVCREPGEGTFTAEVMTDLSDGDLYGVYLVGSASCGDEQTASRCDPSDPQTDPYSDVARDFASDWQQTCSTIDYDVDDDEVVHSSDDVPPKSVELDHLRVHARVAYEIDVDPAQIAPGPHARLTGLPCGQSGGRLTLCADEVNPAPTGRYAVVGMILGGPVPQNDSGNLYEYSFVFDADGQAANNFQASPSFPNDFFQDTDRWYVASYSPSGWVLSVREIVSGAPMTVTNSAARIVIDDNVVLLLVPATELAVAKPSYRVTTFRHTGDYGISPPHDWDGDVEPPVDQPLAEFR